MKKLALVILTALTMSSCSLDPVNLKQLRRVSSFHFEIDKASAVELVLGPEVHKKVEFSLKRKDLKEGNALASSKKDNSAIRAEAMWVGKPYRQSTKHDTYVRIAIDKIDTERFEAFLTLSAKLIHEGTGKYLIVNPSTIRVDGVNYSNLFKKI